MSEASKIIQVRVDTEFKRQVDSLSHEITDKIKSKKDHFRGYTVNDITLFKSDLEEIFEENASSNQYGSPCTLKLKNLITVLITRGVEKSGKEKIARNLVGKIEQFFKEEDSK